MNTSRFPSRPAKYRHEGEKPKPNGAQANPLRLRTKYTVLDADKDTASSCYTDVLTQTYGLPKSKYLEKYKPPSARTDELATASAIVAPLQELLNAKGTINPYVLCCHVPAAAQQLVCERNIEKENETQEPRSNPATEAGTLRLALRESMVYHVAEAQDKKGVGPPDLKHIVTKKNPKAQRPQNHERDLIALADIEVGSGDDAACLVNAVELHLTYVDTPVVGKPDMVKRVVRLRCAYQKKPEYGSNPCKDKRAGKDACVAKEARRLSRKLCSLPITWVSGFGLGAGPRAPAANGKFDAITLLAGTPPPYLEILAPQEEGGSAPPSLCLFAAPAEFEGKLPADRAATETLLDKLDGGGGRRRGHPRLLLASSWGLGGSTASTPEPLFARLECTTAGRLTKHDKGLYAPPGGVAVRLAAAIDFPLDIYDKPDHKAGHSSDFEARLEKDSTRTKQLKQEPWYGGVYPYAFALALEHFKDANTDKPKRNTAQLTNKPEDNQYCMGANGVDSKCYARGSYPPSVMINASPDFKLVTKTTALTIADNVMLATVARTSDRLFAGLNAAIAMGTSAATRRAFSLGLGELTKRPVWPVIKRGAPPGYDNGDVIATADSAEGVDELAGCPDDDPSTVEDINKCKLRRLIDSLPDDPCEVFPVASAYGVKEPPVLHASFCDDKGKQYFVTQVSSTPKGDLCVDYAPTEKYKMACERLTAERKGPSTSLDDKQNPLYKGGAFGVESFLYTNHRNFRMHQFDGWDFLADEQDEFTGEERNTDTTGGRSTDENTGERITDTVTTDTLLLHADSRLTFRQANTGKVALRTTSVQPGAVTKTKTLFSLSPIAYNSVKPTIQLITFTGDIVYENGLSHCGPHGLVARTTTTNDESLAGLWKVFSDAAFKDVSATKTTTTTGSTDDATGSTDDGETPKKGWSVPLVAACSGVFLLNAAIATWRLRGGPKRPHTPPQALGGAAARAPQALAAAAR